MARIPQQSLVTPRETGVAIQPGAFAESAKATASLLGAVSGAADMVKKHFDRAQDLENITSISEKKRLIRNSQGEFLNEMSRDKVAPSQWGSMWAERLKSVKGSLKLDKVPPVVFRAVSEDFENFAGTSLIQIAGEGLKLNQRLATASFNAGQALREDQHDWDGMTKAAKDAVGTTLHESELPQHLQSIEYKKKNADMELAMHDNPNKFQEDLAAGNYDVSKYDEGEWDRSAELVGSRKESSAISSMNERLEAKDATLQTEEDIRKVLHTDPNVSQMAEDAYMENRKSKDPIPKDEYMKIRNEIAALYKLRGNETEYGTAWHKLATKIYSYGTRTLAGGLKSAISNVNPTMFTPEKMEAAAKKGNDLLLRPSKAFAEEIVKDRSRGAFATREAGELPIATFGVPLTSPQKVKAAGIKAKYDEIETEVHYSLQQEMDKWFEEFSRKNPGETPTSGEIVAHLDSVSDDIASKVFKEYDSRETKEIENAYWKKRKEEYLRQDKAKSKKKTSDKGEAPLQEDVEMTATEEFEMKREAAIKFHGLPRAKQLEIEAQAKALNITREEYLEFGDLDGPVDGTLLPHKK
tara:strand:- start:30026 stop:31768 length:1743 start_codon:yes stop_codon:yes gene_type:complete